MMKVEENFLKIIKELNLNSFKQNRLENRENRKVNC